MADYLLEIGTEELPAGYIPDAQAELLQLMTEALNGANLPFESIRTLSTPRRLTLIVGGMATKQTTTHKKVKGPPVRASFDASGAPTKTGIGFAEKHGLQVEQLVREEVGGEEYLYANVTTEGKPAADVISEIVPKVISKLSGERLMRWGSSDMKFSRPIRWIVSLLDNEPVSVALDGLKSGRESAGHRILGPAKVQIKDASSYVSDLRAAHVMVDPEERRKIISEQVAQSAKDVSGVPKQLKGSLLEEVVNITEWPHAVRGEFAKEYLDLPDTLIETIMVHHQRYFPVEKPDADTSAKAAKNNLLPYFITVSNNDRAEAKAMIKQGNERVLRARLADGRFFYFDDQKSKLSDRKDGLQQLTFQEGLGSYGDKMQRLVKASQLINEQLKLEPRLAVCLERAVELCKLDLVSNLVRELPELQGYVGAWYAEREGQPPDVVTAISSHYSPRSTDDTIPGDTVGQFAAVADKIDNIVGLFALGKKPSGSSDPYALRRQAQGLVDILMDGLTAYPLNLTLLVEKLLDQFEPYLKNTKRGFDRNKIRLEVHDFLSQRLTGKLLDAGVGREIASAVIAARDPFENLADVRVRYECLDKLLRSEKGLELVRVGNRVGRILDADSPDAVNPALFANDAERTLWDTFNKEVVKKWRADGSFEAPRTAAEYDQVLELLQAIVAPIDKFFVDVMVNDPDQAKRNNRHGLLKQIDRYFRSIADFPKLQPLLP